MKKIILSFVAVLFAVSVSAQNRYNEVQFDTLSGTYKHNVKLEDAYIFDTDVRKNTVYVNEQVTTHIIMPENIKLVDISTNNIIGNQCADNIVRIKPAGKMYNGELAGTMTVIGERHIAQLNVVYLRNPQRVNSLYNIDIQDTKRYTNPDVTMPDASMAQYAWAIASLPAHYHNVHYKKYGIRGVVNNIYSIGNYFFIDFSLYNTTNIRYDVAEIRVKLSDKKETKASNSQTIEITPVYTLNNDNSFLKGYRNVIVLDKLTFPDEKILTIEVSENQISGRVVYIPIEYNDILHADGFDQKLMEGLIKVENINKNPKGNSSTPVKKDNKKEEKYRQKESNMKAILNDLQGQISNKERYLNNLNEKIQSTERNSRRLEDKINSMKRILNNVGDINTNSND